MRQQRLPNQGQPHALAATVEQRGAQLPFQHPDLLAQRRLGDKEPLGRPGEVQVLGNRHEVTRSRPCTSITISYHVRSWTSHRGGVQS